MVERPQERGITMPEARALTGGGWAWVPERVWAPTAVAWEAVVLGWAAYVS
ncbi:MAG: hypothetical protein ACE5IQ_12730 [Candidatus Methylomirabilales bacterium]